MASRHEMPAAAHVILRNDRDEVLMLQRANTGYEDGKWTVPAGHVESGESASAAAIREAREELGIEISPEDLQFVLISHKRDPVDLEERVDIFFYCSRFNGSPANVEPHKCDGIEWRSSRELDVVFYVAEALRAIEGGSHYAEIGWK